ncbi:hypothetical protein CHCC20441_4133 [Bacillus licheniformis]|uniref:Uncharacterized protein n=1 Tax=Bacillus licheniformis TaxID=1402 RepID=A0A8B5Y5Q2_BACLI|nr:hypothetical protein B4092_2305 [Bacillus licheniformis]TWN16571.1 hypothetical protein CHCC14564_1136 [Bacillus licheniformis LMG 17339]KYC75646.1 hypothetical protein B4090_2332 [Bacillus licheniformis]KYC83816.1 hypothetical protein B4091_2394 [Bacillus licheniformis]KYD01479.1 hypothetical protein B4164_2162 [Bacillus licheniformis]
MQLSFQEEFKLKKYEHQKRPVAAKPVFYHFVFFKVLA